MPPNGECTMEGVPRGRLNLAWANPKYAMPGRHPSLEGRADVWAHLDEKKSGNVEKPKSGNQRTQSIAEQAAEMNNKSPAGKFANHDGGSEQIAKTAGLLNTNASSAFRTKGVYAL